MSNSIFQFEGQRVRHVVLEDAPWFVATDVCRALGVRMGSGAGPYITHIAQDEIKRLKKHDLSQDPKVFQGSSGGLLRLFQGTDANLTLLSESGTNKLIMRSNAPKARLLQDWLARDVLPSLRKTGSYTIPGKEPPPNFTLPPDDPQPAHGIDLVTLVVRQEARIDALIGYIGQMVGAISRLGIPVACIIRECLPRPTG